MGGINAELRKQFAGRLTEFRGKSEKDSFWRSYNLNSAKMGRYENLKEGPSLEKLVEICRRTNLSANWLLLGIEPKLLPARDLLPPLTPEEVIRNANSNSTKVSGAHAKGETKIKKKGSGAISARRIAGSPRK